MLLDTLVAISIIGVTTVSMANGIRAVSLRLTQLEARTQDRLAAESALSKGAASPQVTVTPITNGIKRLTWETIPGRKMERLTR